MLWAWERPEDLRFAGRGVRVAILAGTVDLRGDQALAVPRLQPARVLPNQGLIGTVHVSIDRTGPPLVWTPDQRARTVGAILRFTADARFTTVQLDFEARASERAVLLDVLHDLRAALPPGHLLSMTALASWCDTETWLADAPADEIVPMLFRMGPAGETLKRRIAAGGDFRNPRCHDAVGLSLDTPVHGIPPGRHVYWFNPQPWRPGDLAAAWERSD